MRTTNTQTNEASKQEANTQKSTLPWKEIGSHTGTETPLRPASSAGFEPAVPVSPPLGAVCPRHCRCRLSSSARSANRCMAVVAALPVWLCVIISFFFWVPSYFSGIHQFGEIFAYETGFFKSIHTGSHIPSSRMVHAGCVFVAGIQPSRT